VPEPAGDAGQVALETAAASALPAYQKGMDAFAFHEAIEAAFGIVREANGFIVATAPWNLAKDPAKRGELATVLWASAEVLRIMAILLSPVMPRACARLWEQLGLSEKLNDQRIGDAVWGRMPPGTRVTKGDALFPRIADPA
jgi:methionyl-tRNA synthetase